MTSFFALLVLVLTGCGAQGSKGESDSAPAGGGDGTKEDTQVTPPAPPLPPPQKTPQETPSGPALTLGKIYVASSVMQVISVYQADGSFLNFIDLTKYGSGFVTAMTWLDSSTLLAFFDPGSQGEKIMKITFKGDAVSAVDTEWYKDLSMTNVTVPKMFNPGFANSPLILVSKLSALLEAVTTNNEFSKGQRSGSPYLASSTTCPLAGNAYVTKTPGGRRMILGNSISTNPRVNIYNEDNQCLSSYNFGTSFPAIPSAIVSGIVANEDSVFLRYSHSTTPVLAKCSFDGTQISSCFDLIGNTTVLGVNRSSKELVAGVEPDSLLAPNWDTGAIMRINGTTGEASIFIKDVFSSRVNSISIRP